MIEKVIEKVVGLGIGLVLVGVVFVVVGGHRVVV